MTLIYLSICIERVGGSIHWKAVRVQRSGSYTHTVAKLKLFNKKVKSCLGGNFGKKKNYQTTRAFIRKK